jgi:hypothetical protein
VGVAARGFFQGLERKLPVFPKVGKFHDLLFQALEKPRQNFPDLGNCSGDLWSPTAATGCRYSRTASQLFPLWAGLSSPANQHHNVAQ